MGRPGLGRHLEGLRHRRLGHRRGQRNGVLGTFSATSDGQTASTSGNGQPALSVLGSQTLITSGVLVQQAVARNDGTSAACSGLVGTGGGISIGSDGTCTVTPAAAG